MTAADRIAALRGAGELMFGNRWQQPMPRLLGVSVRTICRYVAGERVVPMSLVENLPATMFAEAFARQNDVIQIERRAAQIAARLICSQEPRKEAA